MSGAVSDVTSKGSTQSLLTLLEDILKREQESKHTTWRERLESKLLCSKISQLLSNELTRNTLRDVKLPQD